MIQLHSQRHWNTRKLQRPTFKLSALLTYAVFIFALLSQASETNAEQTAAGTDTDGVGDSPDRVYLRSITALVFSENGRARTRSGTGRPELVCAGGSAAGFWWKSEYYPHSVQCRNIGWDGSSVQWSCHADLQSNVQFGPDTKVICEPYEEGKSNGYILKDSCRLEYTLNFKQFKLTFAHIIYGCVLGIGLLWFYFQTRYLVHRALKKRKLREREAAAAASEAFFGN